MKYRGFLLAGLMAFASVAHSSVAYSSALEPRDPGKQSRTLTLVGVGEVKSQPDMAVVRLAVVREAKTARDAVRANNAAMSQVIKTVLSAGIAEKDIQTSGFSVQPRYTHFPRSTSQPQRPPEIAGYSVSNNLAVIIRDLDIVGKVLDAVVSAGSNQIGGISFSIQNPKPLRDKARRKAVNDAIGKAKLYAQAAGVILGPIMSISEQGAGSPPRPVFRRAMMAAESLANAVPIARGEQTMRMRVHIVWKIK